MRNGTIGIAWSSIENGGSFAGGCIQIRLIGRLCVGNQERRDTK